MIDSALCRRFHSGQYSSNVAAGHQQRGCLQPNELASWQLLRHNNINQPSSLEKQQHRPRVITRDSGKSGNRYRQRQRWRTTVTELAGSS
ncbi:hypothetical protein [Carnimonas bestiolae]|uniref:hypothetical protein n=1 Tax=Carnimonas bestiolae TaxID=3402172 RepID=UPI003F4A9C1D